MEKNFKKFISHAINKPRIPNIRIDDLKNELYEKSVITKLQISEPLRIYIKELWIIIIYLINLLLILIH